MSISLENEKSRKIIRMLLVSVSIVIIIFFVYQLTTYVKLRNSLVDNMQKERANFIALSSRIDSIEVLIEKIKTDSVFIEKLARENLGMVKKGEKVFKFKKIDPPIQE